MSKDVLVGLKNRVNAVSKPVFNDKSICRKRMNNSSSNSTPMTGAAKKGKVVTTTPVPAVRDRSSSSSLSSCGTLSDPSEMSYLVAAQEQFEAESSPANVVTCDK